MSEFHTDKPGLYKELGLEDLLTNELVQDAALWGDYGNRVTDSDLILSIRRSEETGEFEVVPIDINGARDIIPGDAQATDAYFHPNITPGLGRIYEDTPWDEALDALNDLRLEDRKAALREAHRMGSKGFSAPGLLLDIVRSARRNRELDKAA